MGAKPPVKALSLTIEVSTMEATTITDITASISAFLEAGMIS